MLVCVTARRIMRKNATNFLQEIVVHHHYGSDNALILNKS